MKLSFSKFNFKTPDNLKEFLSILVLFLSWRAALFLVAYFGYFAIPGVDQTHMIANLHPIFRMWLVYDYGWFKDIVAHGYGFNTHSMAFFPMWPATIWLFSKIFFFINTHIVALVVANLITLLDCWVFYKLVLLDYDKEIAYRSVKYFLFFPMSFFLASAYSEPIFLLGVLSAFYFVRKQKYALSGLGGIVASASRLVGSVMILPLFIEAIKQKKNGENWWKILPILIAPLGLIAYILYLKIHFGDALGFLHAYQNSDWDRGMGLSGFSQFWQDIKTLFSFHIFSQGANYVQAIITTGSVLLMTAVLAFNYKKVRLSYLVYAGLIMIVPLLSGSLNSLNRYVLPVFPFFIVLAIWGKKRQIDDLITLIFLVLLGLFTVMFTHWYHITILT